MIKEKVSIVVPIYNVEKYINRCIDSIINQTYTNLQIILVNDGSSDSCGKIADEYAKKDSRIEVIHKENGGLSDARNFGVKKVTGEFTLFVDSDDWLDKSMVGTMVSTINEFNADVVQVAFYYAYKGYLLYDDRFYSEDSEVVTYNNNELMKELVINDKVRNFAWGKLYKSSLIKGIPFKKGVLFEDVFWAHNVMKNVNKYVIIHKPLCYYLQREDSIVSNYSIKNLDILKGLDVFWAHNVMKNVNKYVIIHKPLCYYLQREDSIVSNYSIKNLDILKGLKERHKFIESNYKGLTDKSLNLILRTSILHYNLLVMNSSKDKKGIYRKEIRKYILENYKDLKKSINDKEEDLKNQLMLFKLWGPLNTLVPIKNKVKRKILKNY